MKPPFVWLVYNPNTTAWCTYATRKEAIETYSHSYLKYKVGKYMLVKELEDETDEEPACGGACECGKAPITMDRLLKILKDDEKK